jgi:hypothetical protein
MKHISSQQLISQPFNSQRFTSQHLRSPLFAALIITSLATTAHGQSRDTARSQSSSGSLSLELNPEFATGQYGGSSKIDDQVLTTTLRYSIADWSFKAALPYIRTSSDRTVIRVDSGQIECDNRGSNSGPGGGGGSSGSGSGNSGSGSSNSGSGSGNSGSGSSNSGSGSSGSGNSGSGSSNSGSGSGNSGSGSGGSTSIVSASGSGRGGSVGSDCPSATSTGRKEVNAGMGDASLSVGYRLPKFISGLSMGVKGKVKFATGDVQSGLGSGTTDFTLTTSVAQTIGSWEPFVDLSYKKRGSRNGVAKPNQTGIVVGTRHDFGKDSMLELAYEQKKTQSSNSQPLRTLGLTYSTSLSRSWGIDGYYIRGLTQTVADHAVGMTVSYRF